MTTGRHLSRFIRQMVINVVTFRQAGGQYYNTTAARNLYKLQIKHETIVW